MNPVRQYGCLFSIVGTPIVAVLAALSYARSKTGAAAQIGTFVLLIPVIVVVTVIWALGWSFVVWAATGLVSH